MPRSNWKGLISFGLVSIPIVLYNSEEPASGVSFKQIDKKTGNKIKYKRVDVETDEEVPWEQIGRAYEYSKDVLLPVDEDELKRVAGENARTIAIEEFIDKKNINFLEIDRTYYLVPDKKGTKGYVILREALNRTGKVGIAKVIISTKEYLAAVSTFENALVLHLLRYEEEIRKLADFDVPAEDYKKYKVNPKEIEIAKKLIDSMTEKWSPEKFKDEYKHAVEKWVSEKIHHLPETHMKPRAPEAKGRSGVVNFVDLLKKSLETSKPKKAKTAEKKRAGGKQKMVPPSKQTAQRKHTH